MVTEESKQEPSRGFDISKIAAADARFQEQSKKLAEQFQEANPHLKSLQDAVCDSGAFSAVNELQDALSNGGLSEAVKAAQGISAHLDPLREHAATLAEAAKIAAPANDVLDQLRASGVHDRLSELSATATEGSRLADVIRGIEKQQHALDSMVSPEPVIPNLDHLHIESPIVETNRKLERIESQFSQISAIAHESRRLQRIYRHTLRSFCKSSKERQRTLTNRGAKPLKLDGWH